MISLRNGNLLARFLVLLLFAIESNLAFAQTATTLNDYWAGNAQFDFVRKWTASTNPAMSNTSSIIKVANGKWYMFVREFIGQNCTSPKTSGSSQIGIRAYSSTDQGVTWTQAPVRALTPTPGTDFSCAATDGDVFYDTAAGTWRFLFQCLGDDNIWRGCYAQLPGVEPTGAFTSPATAVIQSASLWNQICDNPGDVCYRAPGSPKVQEEGTFNIFRKDSNGYYWIAFHGYDTLKYGYRGIAKTTDLSSFPQYLAGNSTYGVPADAVLSTADATAWHEAWNSGGNIGAGHGSIVESGGYTYQLAEFSDDNLACVNGQHWDLGIFRTTNVASTQWEQPSIGNPIVLSPRSVENGIIRPCNSQYGQIFVDTTVTPNVTYLKFGRDTSDSNYYGTYLFRLNAATNILKNGKFLNDVNSWLLAPSSQPPNASVYRFANQSPDGTQFLATNCGSWTAACPSGSSVYQDMDVSAYIGRNFRFGGQFSTDQGSGGPTSLALWQFDANYNVLQSDSLAINVNGPTYASFDSPQLTLLQGTRKIRYQFYHGVNAITYHAANLYVKIN